jgi:hypothetical protein
MISGASEGREVPAPHVTTWAFPFLLVLVGFLVVQCCKISVLWCPLRIWRKTMFGSSLLLFVM